MPYVYDDPIMFGQNPFARPVNQRPVPTQSAMTQPMPVRPGSGQATNTQGGQTVNGVPIGPGGRPSLDLLPGVGETAPPIEPAESTFPGFDPLDFDSPEEAQAAFIAGPQTVTMDGTTPEAGGSMSSLFGSGGFEFIGLIAMGLFFFYVARA